MNNSTGCVIVSGGSRGLGLTIVEHCLSRGLAVATFARSSTQEIQDLQQEYDSQLFFASLDIVNFEDVSKFVSDVSAKFGRIYALINNAAIGQDHLLSHISNDKIEQILRINLLAPILLTKSVIKKMLLSEGAAHIVNISSICGSRGYPGLSAYSATKGGIDAFARSMAREVGSRGILVNNIAPGFFLSEMSSLLSDEQMQTITRRTPTGKLIEPEEIFGVLNFLLFDNTNITGQTFFVDGGITI
jgi:3-oxoacyl-[acyl-carrier protein] reductase